MFGLRARLGAPPIAATLFAAITAILPSAALARASPPASAQATRPASDVAIRPFRAHVPDAAVADMRRRIQSTRWPDRETVDDASQGIQLAKLKPLVEYWGTSYDWRKPRRG